MHKLKKIIISLTLSFLLLFSFSVNVFAVHSSGGGNSQYIRYDYEEKDNFDDISYVFNSCPTYCHSNGIISAGFDCHVDLKVTNVVRNSDGFITQIHFTPISDFSAIHALHGTAPVLYDWSPGLLPANLTTIIHSIYSNITNIGYKIDWNYITIPDNLVGAGEQFTYYDYFGKPKTVTFNGNGSIFGANNGGNFELPEGQFPSIADYIPDINDEKYKLTPLSDFLPAMPDSLDLLDWVKYIVSILPITFTWLWTNLSKIITYCIDLFKGFFNFISDFFKLFFDNLRILFTTFFDFSALNLDTYFKSKITELKDYLFLKIPFFHTIDVIKQNIANLSEADSVVFTFSSVTLPFGRGEGQAVVIPEFPVTIDIVNVIRKWTDPIIIGICYFSSFIFFKQKLPDVLGGVGGAVVESQPVEHHKIGF